MKRITVHRMLCFALATLALSGAVQAQTLVNGVKSLKTKTPTVAPMVLGAPPSPTPDPKDRVQWGDKKDPIPIGTSLTMDAAPITTTTSTSPATHRSRAQSVPEPATLGLLALGALALRRRRVR
jgi:PEP-CTERM motif